MFKLTRSPQPDCLAENQESWTQDFVAARKGDSGHRFSWRSESCYKQTREVLCSDTGRRCAYCDGPIGTESRETIDHFRPKGRFPTLAYAWDNLFAACDVCQINKGEKFDQALLKTDEPGYGYSDYFLTNYRTGALEPAPDKSEEAQNRARVTIQMLGLNSEPRKRARLRELKHFSQDSEASLDDYSYRYFLLEG